MTTETTETTETAEGLTAETPDVGTPPEGSPPAEGTEGSKASREAAQRRRQLRETEAERDTLRGRVEGFQRREIERMAGEAMKNPADIWLVATLPALLDDSGEINAEAVTAAVAGATTGEREHWGKPAPDFGAGARKPEEAGPSFGTALKNREF